MGRRRPPDGLRRAGAAGGHLTPEAPRAAVRSYKPRRGRVTPRQQRALEGLWPAYGVDTGDDTGDGALDPVALFGREAPLVLEVGFGMGEATAEAAALDPARDVLAVDVHTPGVGALLDRVHALGLANIRVATGDAVELLRDRIAAESLDEVRAWFPDPWPKARHVKRRLVAAPFAALVTSRLRVGGRLHVATDWAPYADQVLAVVDAAPGLALVSRERGDRPVTRFERQALAAGRAVVDVVAERVG